MDSRFLHHAQHFLGFYGTWTVLPQNARQTQFMCTNQSGYAFTTQVGSESSGDAYKELFSSFPNLENVFTVPALLEPVLWRRVRATKIADFVKSVN